MRARFGIALGAALLLASACSGGTNRASTTTVRVTAGDTTCSVDRAEVPAGPIEVAVANQGTIVTEVYLYAPRDRTIGEVENVEPGGRASFTVTAGGGAYEVACKPGQLGDGVRTPLRVVGDPEPSANAPVDEATARGVSAFAFEVHITADRFAPEVRDLVVVRGQTITFRLHNEAERPRGFAVLGPDGATLATAATTAPGGSATVAVTFTVTGTYTALDPASDRGTPTAAPATFRVID